MKKTVKVRLLIVLGFFIIDIKLSNAQVSPAAGDSLNYNQVLFEIPDLANAKKYRFTVLNDSNTVIKDTLLPSNHIIISGLFAYGRSYSWKYQYMDDKGAVLYVSDFIPFKIRSLPVTVGIIKPSGRLNLPDKQGIVFIDGSRSAINSAGETVWFLAPSFINGIRDLEQMPNGDVKYLTDVHELIKTSMDGTHSIHIPGNEVYKFHHDVIALKNNHFLVCGFLPQSAKQEAAELIGPAAASHGDAQQAASAVLEMNEKGDLVWYFDLVEECKKQLNLDLRGSKESKRLGHMNGLAINDSGTVIYTSFKNFSNVFEIRRKDKAIRRIYGNVNFNAKDTTVSGGNFAAQHCPIVLSNHNLMVFNNNTGIKSSSLVELNKEDKKVWEYAFSAHDSVSSHTGHMGSVTELNNGNFLVCAGYYNNRIFTVSRQKKLTGELFLLTKDSNPMSSYRVSYSPTLYPCVFALRYTKDNKIVDGQAPQLSVAFNIDNAGITDDVYKVRVMGASGKVLHTSLVTVKRKEIKKSVLVFKSTLPDKTFIVEVESTLSSVKRSLKFSRSF